MVRRRHHAASSARVQEGVSPGDRQLFEQAVEQFAQRGGRAQVAAKGDFGPDPGTAGHLGKSLRTTELLPHAQLDLHGCSTDTAAQLVEQFLSKNASGQRLLIVHGRGSGQLARLVRSMLRRDSRVQSLRTAPRRLGGEGAVLVDLH